MQMFKDGLRKNHEDCETHGLLVQSVDGPEKGNEEMKQFATMRHWEKAFDMSPRTTVRQLMVMGNLFKFLSGLNKKLTSGVTKILLEMGNVKSKGLTEKQEQLCETLEKFMHAVDNDSDFVNDDEYDNDEYFQENRFAQQCSNCPLHRCGTFENNDQAQSVEKPQCRMCPVHKCLLKFKTQEWRSVGRPPSKAKAAKEIVGGKK